jgi:DNA-binding NarL/FixJ family response regulator
MARNRNPLNVIIADNQYLVTSSLQSILQNKKQYFVNKIVTDKNEFLKALRAEYGSIFIADVSLIGFENITEIRTIKNEAPGLSILIIANSVSKNELLELHNIGINNVILKTTGKEELFHAIEATAKGRKYYSKDIKKHLLELPERKNINDEADKHLIYSEIEIVRLISNGYTSREIAQHKKINCNTVMSHRKNIFRKLKVNNTSELLIYAIKAHVIDTIEYYI